MSRYPRDVLAPGWQRAGKPVSTEVAAQPGMVLEDPTSGFVGAVVRLENGLLVLEDRAGKRRSFPLGPGFWLDGKPVSVAAPKRTMAGPGRTHTASGSRVSSAAPKVALPSRIYVEGRHDAELVEKVWGDDLRHVGVVVEYLGGIDDLPAIVTEFAPQQGRRLAVLVDHLVPGSKESRIVEQVGNPWLFVTGHRFIDIWTAVKPSVLGLKAWPDVPRGQDYKAGLCRALGWPARTQADIAEAWRHIRSKVTSWRDLDPALLTEVEKLIDFVTADHADTLEP
ncbi:DUF3097 domain-containing protein [Micropruina sonneratiae]|uniref:DUF3097 domain-containing protein n=1 Tax=Micropruina sonneratiae TaxID=2986940 RepID=UPI002226206E|nr:DUF3097 domain-containing protein [Micropruina sp. KQZ13P-5]MCW3158430.1 DUF3097 domain-containing protein [Micropruina sp. KQZ13P-5]